MTTKFFTAPLPLARTLEIAKSAYYHDILGPSTLMEAKIIDSVSSWTLLSRGVHRDTGRTVLLQYFLFETS